MMKENMMKICDKVILTDVDGVLLDWEYAFTQWMEKHNYEVAEFVKKQALERKRKIQETD